MRINKLEIKDFGKFTGDKVIDNIDPRMALVFGRNEAGKTTIFNLIKSMLYGFFPAQSQSHPYSSWVNGRIEFSAFLDTMDGQDVTVYRKLLSRPQGNYLSDEKVHELKNNPLPISKHVSGEIYDKIYSLRVEELIEIQGKAWEEVEDKLLAGYSTASIKSTRDVLKDLRLEHEKIWRESGRGKYQVKELEKEIKELKKIKREAFAREEEIRKADERINEINSIVKALKENKLRVKTLLSKSKELTPIQKSLEQIDILSSRLINEALSSSLPSNMKERLSQLEESSEGIKEEKNNKNQLLQEKNNERYRLNTEDNLILQNKVEINTFVKSYTKIENLRENIDKVKRDIEKLRDRLSHESKNLLTGKWNSDIRKRFEEINKSEINILVNSYRTTTKELHETKLRRDLKDSNSAKIKFSKLYIYSLILSLILIAGGFVMANDKLKLVGLGISIYGLTGILNYANMKKNLTNDTEKNELKKLRDTISKLENRLKEDKKKLMDYLSGIPISDLVIESMDEMFVPSLIKIKDMVYDLRELEKELSINNEEYGKKIEELYSFLGQFLLGPYINEDEKIFLLRDRLEELEKKILLNESIDKEIVEIEKGIKDLEEKEKETSETLEDYMSKLKEIGDGNLEKGLYIVEENYRLRAKINDIESELNEKLDIHSLTKEIERYQEEEPWIFSDYEVLRAEDEYEEMNKKHKDFEVEKARLEETIKKLSENYSLDEIESRLSLLEDDLERACRKRDKLALLSEVIRFADQKFKEENQPDILKNAGRYFEIVTNGKYTDIFLDEDDDGTTIMVKETGEIMPRKVVDTFSKGTLNQLYLSLRLSLIDYLDKDREALPICFDELLVNWDEARFDSSLKLLNEIGRRRQIFIFTCHEWMAEKIEKFFNVKRIVLE